nr:MAG TPA: hypothetical protein [Caudoviricetes sp.]
MWSGLITHMYVQSSDINLIKCFISFLFLKLSGTKIIIFFEKQANKMIFLKLSTMLHIVFIFKIKRYKDNNIF